MENFLYLLELFVENVSFSSNLRERAKPSEVIVSAEIGKFIKMEVFTMQGSDAEKKQSVDLNCGKSTLFACTSAELLKKLKEHPFVISVSVNMKPSGSAVVNWSQEFYTLVTKSAETFGVSGPVTMNDQYLLKEKKTDKIMGDIKASIKLSSFGSSIQTSFQLINSGKDANKKFLVRGARGETTFECQKYGDSSASDLLPVTPLLSNTTNKGAEMPQPLVPNMDDERLSWMALFKSNLDPKFSSAPEEFNIAISNIFNNKNVSSLTFDIVSLMERPEENKCIDLRIRGGSRGFVFEFDTVGESTKDSKTSQTTVPDELTAEKINKALCKNKDCPAVRKFKEMGLGPLAKTKGLGTVMGETSLPLTYGITQTYGVFDEYGPYGLFSRPKRPENPFIPKQDNDWAATCWKPKRRREDTDQETPHCPHCSPLRLTGGGVLDYDDVKSPFHECKEIMDQFDEVLAKYKSALGPCGKPTCPFAPNIIKETCKKMCNHQDEVYSMDSSLEFSNRNVESEASTPKKKIRAKPACGSPKCAYAKYKTGLVDEDAEMELQYLPDAGSGKCGHPKCPYPVQPDLPPIHWDCPDPLPKGRCKNPDCPYLPRELKCLNAVMAKGPCGNLNCPYTAPDPCDSPNCPFASKECPYAQDSESFCGNPDCPYAPKRENSLCENPACPFAKKSDVCSNPTCPYAQPCYPPPCYMTPCGDSPCQIPPCTWQNLLTYCALASGQEPMQVCFGGPVCPSIPPGGDPTCPLKPKPCEKKPSPCYVPASGPCGNPKCPHPAQDTSDVCSRRSNRGDGSVECRSETPADADLQSCTAENGCPLERVAVKNDTCDNTECPFAPKPCYVKPPPCYTAPVQDDICDNPACPYAPQPCYEPPPCPMMPPLCINPYLQNLLPYGMPISICPDGVCPYPPKELLQICFGFPPCPQPCTEQKSTKDDDICDNPECPYTKTDDIGSKKEEDGFEYISETRVEVDNTPCRKDTCKSQGGDLVCEECPCGQDGTPADDGIEYTSDTKVEMDLRPCTKKTCQSTGGTLVCDVCPCSKGETGSIKKKKGKDGKSASTSGKKKKKRRSKNKYVYAIGDKYPGMKIGHRECVMPYCNVPPGMGWLWNIFTPCMSLKPRRGWRPGAIARTIAARIRKHREAQGLQMLELKDFRRGKKGYGTYASGTSINVQPKPTLHIKKHEGCYYITMNPLKDPYSLAENENPYMDCTPLQFKIVKNKDRAKTECGNDEYRSCFCGEDEDVKSLSSDSELEIEFTPPAGIIHPERFKRKRNVVHCDTQYLASDFEKKSEKSGKSKKSKKGKKGKGKKGKKGGKKGKGKKKK